MPSPRLGRPHRDDVLIAAAGLLGGLALWALGLVGSPVQSGLPKSLTLVALLAMSGAELLRRTAPRLGLAIATLALTLDICTGSLIATVVMFTDLIYAAVLYGSPAAARRIPRVSVLVTVLATIVPVAVYRDPQALLIGLGTALITVAPVWTALIIRQHRETAEAERLRAGQTALLAEMDRREAIIAERTRMARELHDMVANHLSAIAIHSTAALSIGDPAASLTALTVIRENSVQGLAEMRRLIGLLRQAGDDEAPAVAPALDGLDALLDLARTNGSGSGLSFTLEDARTAPAAASPGAQDAQEPAPRLPAPVELAAYRIVQESLTNALKHAAPGEVRVRLGFEAGGGRLTVRVRSPYGERPGPRAPGSGAGLVGMAERVALLGGEFEAGPVGSGPDGTDWGGAGPGPTVAVAADDGDGDGDAKIWQVRAALPAEEGTRRT
ncbi:sensor histidine kinase [Streptomyces sp. H27-D2]|uniref:sensor histidine kinase n=1 Tax=Streptomyces sp. H27-D2 TaxID=3046304 RepID=UPI002DBAF06D|nr:histidine kinase [Streptomyces sp. H27-D2]MEC4016717.1 histidine kinase [Streptomyces sp. H27-D2]